MDFLGVLQSAMKEKEEIVFAYLFGSMAIGTENILSDIDIAVYLDLDKVPESGNFGYKSELVLSLEALLPRKVDLVILNEAPIFLAFNIIKNGSKGRDGN
jgi:predicted nucleotidyltransferase